jgi:hypothetical protein
MIASKSFSMAAISESVAAPPLLRCSFAWVTIESACSISRVIAVTPSSAALTVWID